MYFENPYYGINLEASCDEMANQSMFVKQSLMLDGEKGESAKASVKLVKKIAISETKAIAALKSHSEAEKRRRNGINAHLDTLRGLVPHSKKVSRCSCFALIRYSHSVYKIST